VCHPYLNEKGDTQMIYIFAVGLLVVAGIFWTLLCIEGTGDLIEADDE
jgi:hypothetical protein